MPNIAQYRGTEQGGCLCPKAFFRRFHSRAGPSGRRVVAGHAAGLDLGGLVKMQNDNGKLAATVMAAAAAAQRSKAVE